MNALMTFPNLIALIALSGVVAKESKEFFALVEKERLIQRAVKVKADIAT